MRRSSFAVLIGLVATLSMIAMSSQPAWADKSGTPAREAAGVEFTPVTGELVPPLVAEGADVRLERAAFEPGGSLTVSADDAELLLVTVESGALMVRSSAPLVIGRAGSGTTSTVSQRWVSANSDVLLERGDSFVRPPHSQQELRNDRQEPAVAVMASIVGAPEASASPASSSGGLVIALAVVVVPECDEGYDPVEVAPAATPGGGGGGGGAGGVAVAIAAAPECVGTAVGGAAAAAGTPTP